MKCREELITKDMYVVIRSMEQIEVVSKYLDSKGKIWNEGESYLNKNYWYKRRNGLIRYRLSGGCYHLDNSEVRLPTSIIEFDDLFINGDFITF